MLSRFFGRIVRNQSFLIKMRFSTNADQGSTTNFVEIDSIQKYKELITLKDTYVIDFYANWCNPCKKLTPKLIEKLNAPNQKWKLLKINVDEQEEVAREMEISVLPTVFLYKEGKIIDKFVGLPNDAKLTEFIAKANSL